MISGDQWEDFEFWFDASLNDYGTMEYTNLDEDYFVRISRAEWKQNFDRWSLQFYPGSICFFSDDPTNPMNDFDLVTIFEYRNFETGFSKFSYYDTGVQTIDEEFIPMNDNPHYDPDFIDTMITYNGNILYLTGIIVGPLYYPYSPYPRIRYEMGHVIGWKFKWYLYKKQIDKNKRGC